MEQNYRLTIAYDGSRFFGWERQPDKDTIQGKLEAVLGTLQGHPVNVIGAGRTDAGVHARAMTASVVLDVTETPDALRDYLNRTSPTPSLSGRSRRPRPVSTPAITPWARPTATPATPGR